MKVPRKLPGGLASGRRIEDFDAATLAKGAQVETEHTSDFMTAVEIAADHLTEDPRYYDKLERMERGMKGKRKNPMGPDSPRAALGAGAGAALGAYVGGPLGAGIGGAAGSLFGTYLPETVGATTGAYRGVKGARRARKSGPLKSDRELAEEALGRSGNPRKISRKQFDKAVRQLVIPHVHLDYEVPHGGAVNREQRLRAWYDFLEAMIRSGQVDESAWQEWEPPEWIYGPVKSRRARNPDVAKTKARLMR